MMMETAEERFMEGLKIVMFLSVMCNVVLFITTVVLGIIVCWS